MRTSTAVAGWWRLLALVLALALINVSVSPAQKGPQAAGPQPLVIENQGSFFVGGEMKHATVDGSKNPPYGLSNEDDIMVGQMYVQYQIPQGHGSRTPIVLMHGCCLSGKDVGNDT